VKSILLIGLLVIFSMLPANGRSIGACIVDCDMQSNANSEWTLKVL